MHRDARRTGALWCGYRRASGAWCAIAAAGVAIASAVSLSSCGARTPLLVVEPADAGEVDAEAFDATPPGDASPPFDAPIDTTPPLDARGPDVVVHDCPDPEATRVYVVTMEGVLYSFYPPTAAFARIGAVDCPTDGFAFSMAVDRKGTAYVLFDDGQIFEVSTQTAACAKTPYVPGQEHVNLFGMGFVGSASGTGDALYIAPVALSTLGTIDVASFQLSLIAPFAPGMIAQTELAGSGDGRLFAFFPTDTSSAVAELDPETAVVVARDDLWNLPTAGGWAFAYWGGSFYLFTSTTNGSMVTRFNPADRSQTSVASLGDTITGAGVSTCAPLGP
jgi:hypothetical protein